MVLEECPRSGIDRVIFLKVDLREHNVGFETRTYLRLIDDTDSYKVCMILGRSYP